MVESVVSKKAGKKVEPAPKVIPEGEKVVDWSPDFKADGRRITFRATQYMDWVRRALPEAFDPGRRTTDVQDHTRGRKVNGSVIGKRVLYLREMPIYFRDIQWIFFRTIDRGWSRTTLPYRQNGKATGAAGFDGPVQVPVLAPIRDVSDVVMSLTPNEVLTCRGGVRRARGRVLMGGLGLAWMARQVLAREQVESLVVVDNDEATIEFFRKQLLAEHPDRVRLVHGDFYEYEQEHGDEFDRFLIDIWDDLAGAGWDPKLDDVIDRREGQVWFWGHRRQGQGWRM